jgi:uncharacterized protein
LQGDFAPSGQKIMPNYSPQGLDQEGERLPIKMDSASNGEFAPLPLSKAAQYANETAHRWIGTLSNRRGVNRRRFLTSASGVAATLLAFNEAFAAAGKTGGSYHIDNDAAEDDAIARAAFHGNEFILDVQNHHVSLDGPWRDRPRPTWEVALLALPIAKKLGGAPSLTPFGAEQYIREVFVDSDTDIAVLSAVPADPQQNPLTTAEAARTRAMIEQMGGIKRLLIHGGVQPQVPGALDYMQAQAEELKISAWKAYTQWGPTGTGYWLHDEKYGIPMLEKARALGIKTFAVHKGVPLPGVMEGQNSEKFADPRDMGRTARMFPDMTFLVYHSAFIPGVPEGPYDPKEKNPRGVNALIRTFEKHGLARTGNLYAEIGATWRLVMQDPNQAAHVIGKLLKHVGEDRILWGTDCVWFGSPQDQIQAFRTFRISDEYCERFGYPQLTDGARAKIFGLNAAKVYSVDSTIAAGKILDDGIAAMRAEARGLPDPSFLTYGPKTVAEFHALNRLNGYKP